SRRSWHPSRCRDRPPPDARARTTSPEPRLRMLSLEFLRKLRQIELHTRKIIDTTFVGEYRSTFKGTGMEFVDVREYLPGDDIRSIDWKVTARMGRPDRKSVV